MNTADLLEAIRSDIKRELIQDILAELKPEIERRLYANIFTVGEAANYLRLSESTVRRMVREKKIPFFRMRSNIYFRQTDLDLHISRLINKQMKGD